MLDGVNGTQEHDGDDPPCIREFNNLMRDLCVRCKRDTSARDGWRFFFAGYFPCMVGHELSLDGRIIQAVVLSHRLESPPRVPVPAA